MTERAQYHLHHPQADGDVGTLHIDVDYAAAAVVALGNGGFEARHADRDPEAPSPAQMGPVAESAPAWQAERAGEPPEGPDDPDRFALEGQCTLEVTKPCDVAAVLGTMLELGTEAGVATDEIDLIEAKGWTTDAEALQAITAVYDRLPDTDKETGHLIIEAAQAVIFEGKSLAHGEMAAGAEGW